MVKSSMGSTVHACKYIVHDCGEATLSTMPVGFFAFQWASSIKLMGQVWETTTLEQQDECRKVKQLTSCEKCCWCTCMCSSLVTFECRGNISTSLMASTVTCWGRTWKREVTYIKMDFLSGQAVATSGRQMNMHHFGFHIRHEKWAINFTESLQTNEQSIVHVNSLETN